MYRTAGRKKKSEYSTLGNAEGADSRGQTRRKDGQLSLVPPTRQSLRRATHASTEETLKSTELDNPHGIWNEEECTGEPQ